MYSFTRVVDGEERDKVELKLRAFEDKTVNSKSCSFFSSIRLDASSPN